MNAQPCSPGILLSIKTCKMHSVEQSDGSTFEKILNFSSSLKHKIGRYHRNRCLILSTLNSHQLPTVVSPTDCQLCTKTRGRKGLALTQEALRNVSREVSAHQRRKKYQDCVYVFIVLYCVVQTEEKTVRVSLSYRQKLQNGFWRKEPPAHVSVKEVFPGQMELCPSHCSS